MEIALSVFRGVIVLILQAVQLAMLVRAVMSWFPINPNKFTEFLHIVTEPFIVPVRALFQKMNWFRGLPIDMSFMVSYLIITFLLIFL